MLYIYTHAIYIYIDFEQEEILGDIIHGGGDVLLFLNDLEEGLEGDEAGYEHQTMEEESHDCDGGSGDRDDGSGDRTESGPAVAKSARYVYILSLY